MNDIVRAEVSDLEFLVELEKDCFDVERRFNKSQLLRSLTSNNQLVFLIKVDDINVGSIILFKYKFSYRIYSLAVLKKYRKMNLGKELINFAINEANKNNKNKISLEVDLTLNKLIEFYEQFGFKTTKIIANYYGENKPAMRMEHFLNNDDKKIKNIIVYNKYHSWFEKLNKEIIIINSDEFINNDKYKKEEYRVFNLCDSYDYQKIGYYVSLLAEARGQKVIPNIVTIEDVLDESIVNSISDEINELIIKTFKNETLEEIDLEIIWAKVKNPKYLTLAKSLHKLFASPFISFNFIKTKKWYLKKVTLNPSFVNLDEEFIKDANEYLTQKRFYGTHFKNYKYDLAILIDEDDLSPPSDKVALAKFKHAAEKKGFYTEFITKEDYLRINQFDALFIRTTTNVNDYTYQFSRLAYSEGLVVLDDPWSILKCANKLYLHESMDRSDILTPKTFFISKNTNLAEVIEKLSFPIVLKQPDSAASRGVFKVKNSEELNKRLKELFLTSEIIIAQQYLKSDFDWRVGILNNEAVYVCKYYMAKNHWQIYNWKNNSNTYVVGGVKTYLVDDVPKKVLKQALKAAKIMGDGFYGVDLKEVNNKVYVIEINDNPSIDSGWEDKLLKDELYNIIINYFYEKIEEMRNFKKRIHI